MAAGKPLFVGKLSKMDRNRLESARDASADAKYRDRCRAILWSAERKAVPQIGELLDVHRTTAQRWLNDYLRFGLDGLELEDGIRSAVRYLNKKGEAKMSTVVAVTQSVHDAA